MVSFYYAVWYTVDMKRFSIALGGIQWYKVNMTEIKTLSYNCTYGANITIADNFGLYWPDYSRNVLRTIDVKLQI